MIFSPLLESLKHVTSRINEETLKNTILCSGYVFGTFLLLFIIKFVFLSFSFLFFDEVTNFSQQFINHPEKGIRDQNL